MRIDPPDSRPAQAAAHHQFKHFVVIGRECLWQFHKEAQHRRTAIQVAKSKLADDERMNERLACLQDHNKPRILATQVVDPD